MNRPIGLALACWLTGSSAALAADRGYFTLGVAGIVPDGGRAAAYGLGGSGSFGYWLRDRLAVEARVFANAFEADSAAGGSYAQQGFGLDVLGPLGSRQRAHPYVAAGVGGAYNDVGSEALDGSSIYGTAAVGWRGASRPGNATRWRIEARATHDGFDNGQLDAQLGLLVEFGPRAAPAPAPAAPPRKVVHVVAPPEPPPPPDADGDGVPDADDLCGETLGGAKVQADGCVWEEQIITMSDLRFVVNSDQLTNDIRARLDEVARFFRNQPDVVMDVYGHTDAEGSEEFNLQLSKARAASVRAYLISQGIGAERLTSDGFGESRPVADNDTEAGRAKNRRVDLHIHARQPKVD